MPFVSFSSQAPYEVAGAPLAEAREIWLVCHGYGQLARHFIRRFDVLPADCAIVAPQGLARFYLDYAEGKYQQVGASWITREEREADLANMLAYLTAVWQAVENQARPDVVWKVLGFSQGMSTALRWVAHCQIPVQQYFLWAGTPPPELPAEAYPAAPATYILGRNDNFVTPERLAVTRPQLEALFPGLTFHWFDGGHEVTREVLAALV